jgi:2-keto-4-pentenoate hydratase/2-oxohepta-3-ene-1,7-dioic acid hydratase in catechol pathway
MFLLNYIADGQTRLGAKTENGVIDVAAAAGMLAPKGQIPATMEALVAGGQQARASLAAFVADLARQSEADWMLDEASLQLSYCIPKPEKIICVGLNYRQHAIESGMAIPETPVLFSKFNNALAAPGEAIPLPSEVEKYDYEVELAVVMGRWARYVSEAEALDYVLGYCTANDLSERTLQFRTGQWLLGKALDKFLPIGPYLATADEVDDPQDLKLRCWVNGELRQNSNTADMIFTVAQIISYASRYMTLGPGDVISTGTPEGVIQGMKEKVWLKPGDEVTVEIEKLGKLTNVMSKDNE